MKDFVKKAVKNGKKAGPTTRARARTMAFITEVKKLTDLLGPHKKAAVQVWIDGMSATKQVQIARDVWVAEPDWRERRENANQIVAYLDGRPHEFQGQVNTTFEDLGAMRKRFRESPEAMRYLQSMAGSGEPPAKEIESQP